MPTHAVHSALVDMFHADPGAPWKFPVWITLTGIKHGLFPDDNSLLPDGWTREIVDSVVSYMSQYMAKHGQDAKIKFAAARAGAASVPGRDFWRKFCVELWKKFNIHSKITAILTEHSLHPIQIARASRTSSIDFSNLPNGKEYAAQVVDPVGLALFGIECFDKDGAHVDVALRASIRNLIIRTWINICNQSHRSIKRIAKLEEDALVAFNALGDNKPTKTMVKGAIVKVARWKTMAHSLFLDEHIAKVTPIEEQLLALMFSIGAKPVKASEKAKASATKRNDAMIKALLSEGDIDDIFELYRDFFDNTSPADSVDLADQHATIAARFGLNKNMSMDLGIGVESALSDELLAHNLGFEGLLPLLFNHYYHTAGGSAWDTQYEHLFNPEAAKKNPDMAPLSLQWHQLAGVHAIINMNFTSEPTNQPAGCLIADEVGLGKTFLCATVIAFLCDVVNHQTMLEHPDPSIRDCVRLPPILSGKNYLGSYRTVPKLCHLIVVPGTLLSQWSQALQMLFQPRRFEILYYASDPYDRQIFWASGGPFQSSIAGANVIILASHSTLLNEYGTLYSWSKPAASDTERLPWDTQHQRPEYPTRIATTLYGQKYLSVTIDEAQGYRNIGLKHCSALAILELAVLRMPMTATPLQTSTKDAASMGRLLGIPHFLSKDAFLEERDDNSVLRQVRRLDDVLESDPDNMNPEVLEAQTKIIQRMQDHFENRILRRTRDSLDWKGKKLIDLPPCEIITLVIKLSPREITIVTDHANNVKESASSANGLLQICSKDFYLGHRMCIAYARADLAEKIPHFNTLEEWEPKKSTKFDVCARLCKHLLSRDDAPEVEVVDGQVIYPPLPQLKPGVVADRTTKILISQSYPSLGPLLRNILDLHGVKYLYIDGSMSFERRAKIVSQFINNTSHRVLIMSSVGSIGLNLTVATVIIFADQVWSAQDELQIRGRAHRQPQKKTVRCYHILADETADIVLAALARGKHHMMEAFLSQERGREMMATIRGQTISNPEDDYDDEHDPKDICERRKPQSRKKKATIMVSDDDVPTPSSQYKTSDKRQDSDDNFIHGASPVRGEEDSLHYRDPAPDCLTDDMAGSANTSSQDYDTSGTDDFMPPLVNDNDNDFSMMEGPPDLQSTQSSIPKPPKTPPRQHDRGRQTRMRSLVPDSPELARGTKRTRTAPLQDLVGYPSSPAMEVDEDDFLQPLSLAPSILAGTRSLALSNPRLPSTVPLNLTGAPQQPSLIPTAPSATPLPATTPLATTTPVHPPTTQQPRLQSSDLRRASSFGLFSAPRNAQDAHQHPHPVSVQSQRSSTVPPLSSSARRAFSNPHTEGEGVDQLTSGDDNNPFASAHLAPSSEKAPQRDPLRKPTHQNAKSNRVLEKPTPTPSDERRGVFLKAKPTQSQHDANRFHIRANASSSSESLLNSSPAGGALPGPSTRVHPSQRRSTLSKTGSKQNLVIPEASAQSKNPFTRKQQKSKESK